MKIKIELEVDDNFVKVMEDTEKGYDGNKIACFEQYLVETLSEDREHGIARKMYIHENINAAFHFRLRVYRKIDNKYRLKETVEG